MLPLNEPHDMVMLIIASSNGDHRALKALLPQGRAVDSALLRNALCSAARKGHAECIKIMILAASPGTDFSMPLCWAARHGQTECVKLLIPVADPLARHSEALRHAAEKGRMDCVKALLPFSDPEALAEDGLSASTAARRCRQTGVADFIDAWALARKEASALSAASPKVSKAAHERRNSL